MNTDYGGIFYPDAATVNPQKLVQAYLKGCNIHLNKKVCPSDLKGFDAIVIANGASALDMSECTHLPLKTIRGQVTYIQLPKKMSIVKHSIGYGGYIAPVNDHTLVVGSSFDRETNQPVVTDDDDQQNLKVLSTFLPDFDTDLTITGQWAGMRCASKDYLPMVGNVQENLYTLIGLGSYGTVGSLIGAELLTNMMTGTPCPLSKDTKKALSPQRFLDHS